MGKGFLDGYKTYDTSNGFGNARKWQEAFQQRINKDDAKRILKDQNETPHQILGVKKNATSAEIKKAFRRLISEWHPDKNQHRLKEAEEMSKKIIAAYSILTE